MFVRLINLFSGLFDFLFFIITSRDPANLRIKIFFLRVSAVTINKLRRLKFILFYLKSSEPTNLWSKKKMVESGFEPTSPVTEIKRFNHIAKSSHGRKSLE